MRAADVVLEKIFLGRQRNVNVPIVAESLHIRLVFAQNGQHFIDNSAFTASGGLLKRAAVAPNSFLLLLHCVVTR
jgi:hypothetical protein